MNHGLRVAVAMSGGVDSSVAAVILRDAGYDVFGIMLRLWSDEKFGGAEGNKCCTPAQMTEAGKVARTLQIPFYVLDVQDVFRRSIVHPYIDAHARGLTPNPCVECNRQIRFDVLLQHAKAMGADYLATGHYARVKRSADGQALLLRGLDDHKDQSYVLSGISQNQLRHAMFPVGELRKQEVREMAMTRGLRVANRPDSQDLCFLGNSDYRAFLHSHAPDAFVEGEIRHVNGTLLGHHKGLVNYTIGQRKGLNVASLVPLYVIHKDVTTNTLYVGQHEDLGCTRMRLGHFNWIRGEAPVAPVKVMVKIRYKARPVSAMITPAQASQAWLLTDLPAYSAAPGQSAVVYQGEECLGGGQILQTWASALVASQ
jgi:tRNA-uridine 2-sulfurtransferase